MPIFPISRPIASVATTSLWIRHSRRIHRMGHLGDTSRHNLREILRFLDAMAAKDEADYAATGDEQKRIDAAEKRERAVMIRKLLGLRNPPAQK
jgi:hypothetical protein